MITDAQGKAKKDVEITVDLKNQMILAIRARIIRNLEGTKHFLNVDGYEDICGGLYTYAVEEYGKILFLQNQTIIGNRIRFSYSNRDGGFRDHNDKFRRALENIPESCKKLHNGEFSDEFAWQDFNTDVIADFRARMTIFYADFKNENAILSPPIIDKPLLEKAIDDFLTFIKGQEFS